MGNKPLFSIIVVSYNAEDTIGITIDSILSQTFTDYEIIVKDACSKDNTINNIPNDSKIKVFIEKDEGIYYGMNEALGYARGSYCIFMNCGDFFYNNTVLEDVSSLARKYRDKSVVIYGDYIRNGLYVKQPSKIRRFFLYRTSICHQTQFISLVLFSRYGLYDVKYRISADYDFSLKTFMDGVQYIYIPIPVCIYQGGGASESKKGMEIRQEDYKKITESYYPTTERIVYKTLIKISAKGLRERIVNDATPEWIRKIYRQIVNAINR